MMNDIRFLYLRDTTSDRVVTIARRLVDDENGCCMVEFAFSANRPTPSVDQNGRWHSADRFSKTIGRHIAQSRLEMGKSFRTPLRDEQRPIETILMFLGFSDNPDVPPTVRRIAAKEFMDVGHQNTDMPDRSAYDYSAW